LRRKRKLFFLILCIFLRYTFPMAMNSGINVRLEPETRDRLERLSDQTGIKPSALIRRAILEYCERVERTGQLIIDVAPPRSSQGKAAS
jgi:antitoxin component of RelBE/YafQ-DinJ toxin-antitoxin module